MSCCSFVVVRLTPVQRGELDAAAGRIGVPTDQLARDLVLAGLAQQRESLAPKVSR